MKQHHRINHLCAYLRHVDFIGLFGRLIEADPLLNITSTCLLLFRLIPQILNDEKNP